MNLKKVCFTGECGQMDEQLSEEVVRLSEGSGGVEMVSLIDKICSFFYKSKQWSNLSDDGATMKFKDDTLVFTTDSYVVTPIFFPGGNIGDLAFCGTVNDLAMMGGSPKGLSLSLVLEEGLSKKELFEIIETIGKLSKKYKIPIVTGDTKVVEKGAVDKIMITTSGVASTTVSLAKNIKQGDKVIVSGGIGEHGTTLITKRFELESDLVTDSKPLHLEIQLIKKYIKQAKDITRGGLAAILNDFSQSIKMQIEINEKNVPIKKEVLTLTEILGLDVYSLASEGRFICIVSAENAKKTLDELQKFNKMASIIGEIKQGNGVKIKTMFGKRMLSMPSGNIVPRIC